MTEGRLFVDFKMAGLYPEGTVIVDRRGQEWYSWRPDSYAAYDLAPEWRKRTK